MSGFFIADINECGAVEGLIEQLVKTSHADVLLSSREKELRKTLRGEGGSTPLVRPRVKAISVSFVSSSRI